MSILSAPSIASVSKMVITSRPADSELGTTVISQYGSIKKVHETGCRVGTTIEVANLFGNTPARRKFLRTTRTELLHIDDTVKNYALARPDVGFTLRVNDRQTIMLESGMDLQGRLQALLNYQGTLIPVRSGPTGPDGIQVEGLLLPPESTAPVAGRIRLFVNNRAIKDRLLMHAVSEGLRSFLLKGKNPAGIVKVELPPELVDVNVHPAKQEVRFRNSRTVHQKVVVAVRDAMLDQQQLVRQHVFSQREPDPTSQQVEAVVSPDERRYGTPDDRDHTSEPYKETPSTPSARPLFQAREHVPIQSSDGADGYETLSTAELSTEPVQVDDLVVIGSFQDLYIFCRNHDRLVVIDQHAAHERLLYEELRRQFLGGRVASQNLLFPVTLELTPFQSNLVETHLEALENMGFAIRDFGGTTWILSGIPALGSAAVPQDLFFDVIEQFGSEKERHGGDLLDTILATMACKAAVKSGDSLSDQEIRGLLEKMARADLFSHCPHGRPVVKIFKPVDIKNWFHRT